MPCSLALRSVALGLPYQAIVDILDIDQLIILVSSLYPLIRLLANLSPYPQHPLPICEIEMVTQYWQVLNLDRRETLGQDSWGEMHDILQSTAPDGLIYQLIATEDRGSKSLDDISVVAGVKRNSLDNPSNPNNIPSNPPSNLPFINPPNDATAPGSWSTDRIVTISDYALSYPDGMLTLSEMDEIEDMYLDDSEDDEYEEGDPAPTLYSFAEEWYGAVPIKFLACGDVALVGPSGGGKESEEQGRDPKEKKGQEEQGKQEQEQEQPILHLRNLTKKQYVRSDAITRICPERIISQAGEVATNLKPIAPGLGHALVVLTCWTSEVEIFGGEVGEVEVEVGKGTWVGDRIEVMVVKKGADKKDKEEWKDVSEEVASVLDTVWKSLAF